MEIKHNKIKYIKIKQKLLLISLTSKQTEKKMCKKSTRNGDTFLHTLRSLIQVLN